MRIAIDAMGGDNAPQAIVAGAIRAEKEFDDVTIVLYGDEEQIEKYMVDQNGSTIEVVHTTEKIEGDDSVKAVRRKKDSSMVVAAKSVKEGENDAIVSAGNTAALLTAGTLIVGRIKGIDRPGLMTTFPAITGEKDSFNFLDLGANSDSKPENINQYAVLGTYYSKKIQGIPNPKVALLNNGTEENKGNEISRKAYELLSQNESIQFIGNVEARELLSGPADVIVTDGFTGNAVLKSIEGTAKALLQVITKTIKESGAKGKLGGALLKNDLSGLKDQLDYSKHGGAVLVGVKAPVIKTHGSANADAVYSTIRQTRTMLSSNVIDELVKYFESK